MDTDIDLDLDVDWSGFLHLPSPGMSDEVLPPLYTVSSGLDYDPACSEPLLGRLPGSFAPTHSPPPLLAPAGISNPHYDVIGHETLADADQVIVVPPDRLFAEDELILASASPLFAPSILDAFARPPLPTGLPIINATGGPNSAIIATAVTTTPNSSPLPLEAAHDPMGPGFLDLNVQSTLQLYNQILLWYVSPQAEPEMVFYNCLPSSEAILHGLAMRFGLSYSFDCASRTTTLRRPSPATRPTQVPTLSFVPIAANRSDAIPAATSYSLPSTISASQYHDYQPLQLQAHDQSVIQPLQTDPNPTAITALCRLPVATPEWSPDLSARLSRASSHPSRFSAFSLSSSISSAPATPITPTTPAILSASSFSPLEASQTFNFSPYFHAHSQSQSHSRSQSHSNIYASPHPSSRLTAYPNSYSDSQLHIHPKGNQSFHPNTQFDVHANFCSVPPAQSQVKNAGTMLLGDSISHRVSAWKIFSSGGRSLGRKGPLSAYSREKLRALEAVGGACWRCKVIRRKCDPGSPCKSCPAPHLREDAPLWPMIGCRRGSLSEAMPRQSLCPKSRRPGSRSSPPNTDPNFAAVAANHIQVDAIAARCLRDAEEQLLSDAKEAFNLGSAPEQMADLARRGNPDAAVVFAAIVTGSAYRDSVSLNKRCRIHNKALTCADLITGIAWDLADCRDLAPLLEIDSPDRLVRLLTTACIYEEEVAKSSTSLVIFSVICLRYSLDVLRLHRAGLVGPCAHETCTADQCAISSIRVLCSYLAAYVEELSLVVFKKENLRDRRWWLSTFYSLSIQSHVRHALVAVERELVFPSARGDDELPPESLYSTRYLHVAAILFTAASAQYDPLLGGRLQYALTDDSVVPETAVPELHHLSARDVFEVDSWPEKGIRTSYQYLRRLLQIGSLDFEPDGGGDCQMVDVGAGVGLGFGLGLGLGLGLEWSSLQRASRPLQSTPISSRLLSPPRTARSQQVLVQAPTVPIHSGASVSDTSIQSGWTGSTGLLSSRMNSSGTVTGCRNSLVSVDEEEKVGEQTYVCDCCSKKPRRFKTAEELQAHAGEKGHGCGACAARFRTAAEACRHHNAVHRRRDSWQCARLCGPVAAFHSLTTVPATDVVATFDICGYCGRGFQREACAAPGANAHLDQLASHVHDAHAFVGCNREKLFYRADHFRQHLRVFHGAVSGKWTRFLERTCKASEDDNMLG